MKNSIFKSALALATVSVVACQNVSSLAPQATSSLIFDDQNYSVQELTVNGQTFKVRAYENIAYVSQPVEKDYQVMNIYIPEAYYQGQTINGFHAQNAPIFFPNQIGGYMPAKAGTAQPSSTGRNAGKQTTIAVALSQGFVVASPAARGRTSATGKAPAAIVDLKAAVRYLRFNDARMLGSAEKIISNGTSAGGALSALLGASGNSGDYARELQKLGAAQARDDIFAVSAYCPITNLEHADAAYEWQFNGHHDYKKIKISMLDYNVKREEQAGRLTDAEIQLSQQLKPLFSPYVNRLALKDTQGRPLTLDAQGNGSFKDWVKHYVMQSAQKALDQGQDLSAYSWLKVSNQRVLDLDFNQYIADIGRMKTPPAFDAVDLSSGENQLFGSAEVDQRHFTDFAMQHHTGSQVAQRADAQSVKMMNAMNYIGTSATTSKHWRIRHGSKDRDTSLAIPVILATKLQNHGHQVDFALPWGVAHSGDYDLDELFTWAIQISRDK
ncbi:MAG: subtype B tannase [Acinetobacter sp.]|nr:subtype B tannase [Acinetobacter sp.]